MGQQHEDLSPIALLRTCHDVLESLATIMVNLQFVEEWAREAGDEPVEAMADALQGVRRATEIVRALQAAARAKAGRVA
jgi:hypothetical protein